MDLPLPLGGVVTSLRVFVSQIAFDAHQYCRSPGSPLGAFPVLGVRRNLRTGVTAPD